MEQKIALIGFGTVGQGLVEILENKKSDLISNYGYNYSIVAISDIRFGTVYDPEGLDVTQLLAEIRDTGSFQHNLTDWDALTLIKNCNADVVCELAFTDLETGEPAISHCMAAFESRKHIVTSNKGPAALAYKKMKDLADKYNVMFMIEGTVMSGTPVLNLTSGPLAGCRISSAKGILNGTTNYILSEMENGMEYKDALKKAQELGYAEADPTGDVEGYDARAKVTILANVVMGVPCLLNEVTCEGISAITAGDIQNARENNSRWKLIGNVEYIDGNLTASVKPEMIALTHPLAGIMGPTNAATFSTDLLGDITIVGAGAGKIETGFSILSDLLEIHRLS